VLRRLAAMVYEALLVAALLFLGAAIGTALAGGTASGPARIALQIFLFVLLGIYFIFSWRRGGRTLAMKAWHLRVVGADGSAITPLRATLRYVIAAALVCAALIGAVDLYRHGSSAWAWAAIAPMAASVVWGFLDGQGRFLHDRISGTKIVHEKTVGA
jgi:uncharacterized RDD family membrane protein YckC